MTGTATTADMLAIDITVVGGPTVQRTLPREQGDATGGLQIEFPNGYPTGQTVRVTVAARSGATELASNFVDVALTASCERTKLVVGDNTPLPDLAGTPAGDLAGDLASDAAMPLGDMTPAISDLIGSDFFVCPTGTVESCFNGTDDDCDGLIDCADPDCTGGATPLADCVENPGSNTYGTTDPTTCPSAYALRTDLQYDFVDSSCNAGTATCPSGTVTGACQLTRTTFSGAGCTSATAQHNFQSNTCQPLPAVTNGNYYQWSASPTWIAPTSCAGTGAAAKVAARFDSSEAFCARTGDIGGGCAANKVCVPHAPNHCVLVTGDRAICPSGYTQDPTRYYLSFNDPRTCSFTCSGSAGTCPSNSSLRDGCSNFFGIPTSCLPDTDVTNNHDTIIVEGPTAGGSCGTLTVVSSIGTAGPTNPRTVCCEP